MNVGLLIIHQKNSGSQFQTAVLGSAKKGLHKKGKILDLNKTYSQLSSLFLPDHPTKGLSNEC